MRTVKHKTRTLIVEDNENNMYLASFLLENVGGHEVLKAFDFDTGLKLAQDEKPDLLLLDIQLGDKNGLDIARALKSNPSYKNIVIVALTAFAMSGDKEKAVEAGCDGFLPKPINPDTFIDDVEKFLVA